ncbi:Nuf2 family-domain-containing protein [Dichotomocladium elegans]|nr:Nuf2 family-domain-containing protein [Dichotomocladium elegans]
MQTFDRPREDTQEFTKRLYDLPTLTTDQLLLAFQEMLVPVTEQDLLHPTSTSTLQIFSSILLQLDPQAYEAIEQMAARLTPSDTVSMPLENSFLMFKIYKQMKKLLASIRFEDFEQVDVTQPVPHRLARILSALVNYAKFREQQWKSFEPFVVVSDGLLEEIRHTAQRNADLGASLVTKRDTVRAEEPSYRLLESHNAEFAQSLRDIRKVADGLQARLNELKSSRNLLKDQMQDIQFQVLETIEKEKEGQATLQSDPHQIQQNIAGLKAEIDQYLHKIGQIAQLQEERKKSLEDLDEISKNAEKTIWEAREATKNMREVFQIKQDTTAIQGEYQNSSTIVETLDQNLVASNTERALHILKVKEEKEYENHTRFQENYPARLERHDLEIRAAMAEVAEANNEKAAVTAAINEISSQLQDMKNSIAQDDRTLDAQANTILSSLNTYFDYIMSLKKDA